MKMLHRLDVFLRSLAGFGVGIVELASNEIPDMFSIDR